MPNFKHLNFCTFANFVPSKIQNPWAIDYTYYTAFHLASENGHLKVEFELKIEMLIHRSSELNIELKFKIKMA